MTIQRHNPAYRSAYKKRKKVYRLAEISADGIPFLFTYYVFLCIFLRSIYSGRFLFPRQTE